MTAREDVARVLEAEVLTYLMISTISGQFV
jgi:hypothetical protein